MAIFHLSAKIVSRSKGQSAIAKAAYNARDQLRDERTGELKDYSRRSGLLFSGIYAPKDAPEWAHDRAELWNRAEAAETRKNSQLAREIEIALPHELTDEQRRFLVQDFVREQFVRRGMVADVCIHAPDREGDERNYHAHILLTTREIGPEGFTGKNRDWNKGETLEAWREGWERTANKHLERHGHKERIDRRTLEAQGIDREPTKHLGPTVCAMQRRGIEPNRYAELKALEKETRELAEARRNLADVSRQLDQAQQRTAQPEPSHEPDDSAAAFLAHQERAKLDKDAQRIEAERDRAPTGNGPQLGATTAQGLGMAANVAGKVFNRVEDIAGQLLDMLGPAPPPLTYRDYLASKEAREQYFQQQREQAERDATLDKIINDRKTGKNLNPEAMRDDLRKLGRDNLETIKKYGDDGIRRLIDERERELLQRHRDRDRGRER